MDTEYNDRTAFDTEEYGSGTDFTSDESSSGQSGAQSADMVGMMQQCGLPAKICGWLRCLRTPGMSLSYSVEKQHISDMDAYKRQNSQAASSNDPSDSEDDYRGTGSESNECSCESSGYSTESSGCSCGEGNACTCGAKPGTMRCTGACEVRYFDLAVVSMLALTMGCAVKCLLGCGRLVKRKM